jgi:HTH-type transcriptional regulator/antitoxin HigA
MAQFPFSPNYAVPPGTLLQEYLDERGISARELARRCGRSPKLMAEILAGKAPVEPETAIQLERVVDGIDAATLLQMEAAYRLNLARSEETAQLATHIGWAKQFPLKELEKLNKIATSKDPAECVRQLLNFFGAASVPACIERGREELNAIAFRHSQAFDSREAVLLTWLRLGYLEAEQMECAEYDRTKFLETLRSIRNLTTKPVDVFLPELRKRCARAGVAFIVLKPFKGVALSGISRWLASKKALIQQTLRHLSNDHFWFTFYHECAHLLLHSRKTTFVDGPPKSTGAVPAAEHEANDWAANFLVPQNEMTRFITRFSYTEDEVIKFATAQGVAPGIVVGQLQHRKVLSFHEMNHLRERYIWSPAESG